MRREAVLPQHVLDGDGRLLVVHRARIKLVQLLHKGLGLVRLVAHRRERILEGGASARPVDAAWTHREVLTRCRAYRPVILARRRRARGNLRLVLAHGCGGGRRVARRIRPGGRRQKNPVSAREHTVNFASGLRKARVSPSYRAISEVIVKSTIFRPSQAPQSPSPPPRPMLPMPTRHTSPRLPTCRSALRSRRTDERNAAVCDVCGPQATLSRRIPAAPPRRAALASLSGASGELRASTTMDSPI